MSAFVLVAVLVLVLVLADVTAVRRDLQAKLAQAPFGRAAAAERALSRALRRRSPDKQREEIAQAIKLGRQAVEASGGLVGAPFATIGCAYLASLDGAEPPPDALLPAERLLGRALELGPATPAMWAAWSLAAEERDEFEQAAARWLDAARMVARDVLELPSMVTFDVERDIRGARFSKELFAWPFRPRHARAYALALDAADPSDPAVLLTAGVLARIAKQQPATGDEAQAGLRRILDRGLGSPAPSAALSLAHGLRNAGRGVPRELRRLGGEYTELGAQAVLRPATKLVSLLEHGAAEQAATGEKMQRVLDDMEADRRRLAEKQQESEERWDRIRRGEATADDLAWQETMIEEAVKRADAFDPAALEAEREEMLRRRGWEARDDAALEASVRELKLTRERLDRLSRGRATAEDLEWRRHQQNDTAPP